MLPVIADHTERAVARVHERHRRLDDAREDLSQLEVRADRHDGLEEVTHAFLGTSCHGGPGTQLVKQVLELEAPDPAQHRLWNGAVSWRVHVVIVGPKYRDVCPVGGCVRGRTLKP